MQFRTTDGAASYGGGRGLDQTALDGTGNGAVYIAPSKDAAGDWASPSAQQDGPDEVFVTEKIPGAGLRSQLLPSSNWRNCERRLSTRRSPEAQSAPRPRYPIPESESAEFTVAAEAPSGSAAVRSP